MLLAACGAPVARDAPSRDIAFVGSAQCGSCHADAYSRWRASQHAMAMQPASDSTVLGDFDDAAFTEDGTTSRFFRRDGGFFVNTAGPDGELHDYEVRFTFGVAPLQQYLVPFPGGRLQPLTLAWDTRPAASGGQRWLSLDLVAPIGPHDAMHWSGRGMNWNYMCADCHATAVRKGYVAAADSFATRYAELGVGCEACHGPGGAHTEWARWPRLMRRLLWRDNGLTARLDERRGVTWTGDVTTGLPSRSVIATSSREMDACAPCHARRVHIADGYVAGAPLLDYYDPQVLVPSLYHADGQQLDEVYDHASFLQSRMHVAGVTCADCHDPHTQKLRAPGRATCLQCHPATTYDTAAHHGHQRRSTGSDCAACHMPVTTYLEIDGRHDHSIRVPRPDRSASIGVPNACTACHSDKTLAWAMTSVAQWTRRGTGGNQRFAESFAADDRGEPGAVQALLAVARDQRESGVARASAFARLARYPDTTIVAVARDGAADREPLVRRWAMEALSLATDESKLEVIAPLLSDSLRAIRQRAAWHLARVAHRLPTPELRAAFARAEDEFVASQRYNADRADHRVALGVYFLARGDTASALDEFRQAARQWPRHVDAVVNLAGVLSLQEREGDAERVLRDAIRAVPDEGALHHAVALSLARQGRDAEAIEAAQRATRLSEGNAEVQRTLDALRRVRKGKKGGR